MNAIITIDKLILCYQITNNFILNKSYINHFIRFDKTYDFKNKLVKGYINNSEKEKEIINSFNIKLEYKGKDIGTLFISNTSSDYFYFKFHKSIFYKNEFSLREIKKLIDCLFDFDYTFHQITRLEIACDTSGDPANDLFVIADLCKDNQFFRSIRNSKGISKSSENLGGRKVNDARYSLCFGNTKIFHHTKFEGSTCIGSQKSDIFLRCYNKTNWSKDFQNTYFSKFFPESSEIFRLEVSLNSIAINKLGVQFKHLGENDYLKFIYFKVATPRLTFNVRDKYKWKNGNKVFNKICLLDSLDFGNGKEDLNVIEQLYSFSQRSGKKEKTNDQIIVKERSIVGSFIRKYLKNENRESSLDSIYSMIQSKNLCFGKVKVNQWQNFNVVNELIDKHLKEKNYESAIVNTSELKLRLNELVIKETTISVPKSELIEKFESESISAMSNIRFRQRLKIVSNVVSTIIETRIDGRLFGFQVKTIDEIKSKSFI